MTYRRFSTIATRVRYKPGWEFIVAKDGDDAWVFARVKIVDAYPPHGATSADLGDHYFPFAGLETEDQVVRCVRQVIESVERHELGEWFRYRGRRVFDPHSRRR